jgi:hypothetical protein
MVLDREPFREKFVRLDLPLFIDMVIPDCYGAADPSGCRAIGSQNREDT